MSFDAALAGKLAQGLLYLYDNIDAGKVKRGVDEHGLEGFIHRCAIEAGAVGAIGGIAGLASEALGGAPVTILNTVVQQFRVTMAVIYAKRGTPKPAFKDFLAIVALSLGVEMGVAFGTGVTLAVAEQILIVLGASEGGSAIPLVGAFVAGGANLGFIEAIGHSLQHLDMKPAATA